tara:strand:- start:20753 stop:21388 length:636 start_codon:yes stop_codon:yes gene_type:complete
MEPNKGMLDVMLPAYRPCLNFGICKEAVWKPEVGHIPRGFFGATGALSEVQLIMIFAEPGHTYGEEEYDPNSDAMNLLMHGVRHTYSCFESGRDQFHRNTRWFLDRVFPQMSFDEQLKHVWMTEGRLCSVAKEIGGFKDRTCSSHYLGKQIELLPNATVVAFGGKAQDYMKSIRSDWIRAYALSPPGANHRPARPSWEAAIEAIWTRQERG